MRKLKILIVFLILQLLIISPTWAKSFKFAQITDVHYSSDGTTSSKRNLSESAKNIEFAVNSMNKQDILFSIFLGDNIDKSNPTNLNNFLKLTQPLKMPHYFILGNHDAYKLSGIPKEEYLDAVRLYNPYQKNKKGNFYFFPNKDCIAIVMDGAMPFMPSTHGTYVDEQVKWLDSVLTKNEDKFALIFQHFPLIPPTDNYSHTTLNSEKYLKLLKKHKNIILISSGHFHADKITIDDNGIYHISVPTLLAPPHEYEIIEINYQKKLFQHPKNIKVNITKVQV